MRTPYFYDACSRTTQRCVESPNTHAVVRFWSVSPAPHIVSAFAAAVDALCERMGDGASATTEVVHPESTTRALVVRLPCGIDGERAAELTAMSLVAQSAVDIIEALRLI